jgi:hypothetical protein
MPTPSDDPRRSASATSARARIESFTGCDQITPDDTIIRSDDRSYGSPRCSAASSSATIGLANASPTIVRFVTRCVAIASSSSAASRLLDATVTTVPPAVNAPSDAMADVPCMRGAAARSRGVRPSSASCRAVAPKPSRVVGISTLAPRKVGSAVPIRLRWGHMTPLGMPVVPPV